MAELATVPLARIKVENNQWRSKLFTSLWALQNKQDLCDFIVADINNFGIPVHSCVIAAASDKLADVINQVKATNTNVFMLEQVTVSVILAMVEFVYTGQTTVDSTDIESLHALAQELGLVDLTAAILEPDKYAERPELVKTEKTEQQLEPTLEDMLQNAGNIEQKVEVEKFEQCCQTDDVVILDVIANTPKVACEDQDAQTDITGDLNNDEFEMVLCCDTGLMVKRLIVKEYDNQVTQTDTTTTTQIVNKYVKIQLTKCDEDVVDTNGSGDSKTNMDLEEIRTFDRSKPIKTYSKSPGSSPSKAFLINSQNAKPGPIKFPMMAQSTQTSVKDKLEKSKQDKMKSITAKSGTPDVKKSNPKVTESKKSTPKMTQSKKATPKISESKKSTPKVSEPKKSTPKVTESKKPTAKVSQTKPSSSNPPITKAVIPESDENLTPSRKSSRARKVNTKYANEEWDSAAPVTIKAEPDDSDEAYCSPIAKMKSSDSRALRSGIKVEQTTPKKPTPNTKSGSKNTKDQSDVPKSSKQQSNAKSTKESTTPARSSKRKASEETDEETQSKRIKSEMEVKPEEDASKMDTDDSAKQTEDTDDTLKEPISKDLEEESSTGNDKETEKKGKVIKTGDVETAAKKIIEPKKKTEKINEDSKIEFRSEDPSFIQESVNSKSCENDDENISFELNESEMAPLSEDDESGGELYAVNKVGNNSVEIEEVKKQKKFKQNPVVLTCPECKIDITGTRNFRKHRRDEHDVKEEDMFKCQECGTKFQRGVDLKRHAFSHTSRRLNCPHCDKDFKTDDYLKFHIKSEHGPPKFLCMECGFATGDKRKLKHHEARFHGPNSTRDWKCSKCLRSFKKQKTLLEHKCTYTEFECDHCEQVFNTFLKYSKHVAREHTFDPDPFQCVQCEFSTWHYTSIQLHEETHRNLRLRCKCPVCNKTFSNKNYLLFHLRKHGDKYKNMTEDELPSECILYETSAGSQRPRKYTQQQTIDQADDSSQQQPAETASSVQAVKRELEESQTDSTFVEILNDDGESTGALAELTKDLTRDAPDGTYFTVRTLEDGTIVMETHQMENTGEEIDTDVNKDAGLMQADEQIELAGKDEVAVTVSSQADTTSDGNQSGMENVFLEVEGAEGKKLVCIQVPSGMDGETQQVIEECTKLYENFQDGANEAPITDEIGEEDDVTTRSYYKCKFCPKKFRFRHHLQRHEMSHTGEKPFQCSICKKRDHDISNLRKHLLTHSEAKHKCEKCGKFFRTEIGVFNHQKADCQTKRKKYKKRVKELMPSITPIDESSQGAENSAQVSSNDDEPATNTDQVPDPNITADDPGVTACIEMIQQSEQLGSSRNVAEASENRDNGQLQIVIKEEV